MKTKALTTADRHSESRSTLRGMLGRIAGLGFAGTWALHAQTEFPAIPEPSTFILVLTGVAALGYKVYRDRKKDRSGR